MSYKLFKHLKKMFGILLLQPSEMLTWMTFISLHVLFFFYGIQCMKKITEKVEDICHCGKCDGEFAECDYWYILKVDLEDVTGNIHGVITFDDDANQLMGISAKGLSSLN